MKVRILSAAAALLCISALSNLPERSRASPDLPAQPSSRISLSGAQPASIKSLLNVRRPMQYGQFVWDDAGVPSGPVTIRVDLDSQLISIFRAGHEIGTAVILYGADAKPTPTGSFPILAMRKDHRSSLYDAAMPFTLRLTNDGVAIHGSDVREGAATHGCIGVPTAFAERVFEQVKVGDEVTIVAGG